jgi:mannose-6-phosphate isomerase-like protein (cupin superfamily)
MPHRDEQPWGWIVPRGEGLATVGQSTRQLGVGDHCHIPVGQLRRLTNVGARPLRLIELQLGDLLSEKDIVRLEDDHGRG